MSNCKEYKKKMEQNNSKKAEIEKLAVSSFIKRLKVSLMLIVFCFILIACSAPILNNHPVSAKVTGIIFRPINLVENSPNAFTYYVKSNDEIRIQWDSYQLLWSKDDLDEGELNNCTFGEMPNATSENIPDNCDYLDFCRSETEGEFGLRLVADNNFMRSGNPDHLMYMDDNRRYKRACSSNQEETPLLFDAITSGLYRLADAAEAGSPEIFEGVTNNEAKIHVLDSVRNKSQTVKFDLIKQRFGSTDYWVWKMPNNPVWQHNFSKNVKVSKVRILENGNDIKPSRVIFLPAFQGIVNSHGQEQSNSCYINNNEINLNECDNNSNIGVETINPKTTTPVYTQNQPPDLLTWLVEFNTNQGGDDATNATDLEIEFTIEAVN